jgi:hypothetical protein
MIIYYLTICFYNKSQTFFKMLIRNIITKNQKTLLSHQSKYFLLDHHKMEKVK